MGAYVDPAVSYGMPMVRGLPMMAEGGAQHLPYGGGFGGGDYFMPYAAGDGGFADYATMGYGLSCWWSSPTRPRAAWRPSAARAAGRAGARAAAASGAPEEATAPCAGGVGWCGVEDAYHISILISGARG
mmetsp:Transcript_88206/g.246151  ORF Transcript_88206/g.246151 Transcript_88206/m.246151 type:complete len:130 (-) Transcript_88206:279-668(-)